MKRTGSPNNLRVAVYAVAQHGEKGVRRWHESARDADLLQIINVNPRIKSLFVAKSLGIKVRDVSVDPWRFDIARNAAIALLPKDIDICISLDLNETLSEGWREVIEGAWKAGINMPAILDTNPRGLGEASNTQRATLRIHPREGFFWQNAYNEELVHKPSISVHSEPIDVSLSRFEDSETLISATFDSKRLADIEIDLRSNQDDFALNQEYIEELFLGQHWRKVLQRADFLFELLPPSGIEVANSYLIASEAALNLSLNSSAQFWAERATEAAPDFYEAWHWRAHVLHLSRKWVQAYDFASKILTLEKGTHRFVRENIWNWWGYDLLALSAHKLGKNDEAVDYGERALQGAPFDPRLVRNLAIYRQALAHDLAQGRRPKVQSFDIFDTLIARRVRNPHVIFELIEARGNPGFKANRIRAEYESDGTWLDIYRRFREISGMRPLEVENLMDLEFETEAANLYPIREMMNKVNDGDILITDMYFAADQILKLLKSCGFNKRVKIFQTPAGKRTGSIWEEVSKRYEIELHIGDNFNSDVLMAQRAGVPASHFAESRHTWVEEYLHDAGMHVIAELVREFRLSVVHSDIGVRKDIFEVQATLNLPCLLLISKSLADRMSRDKHTRLLFSTRDSCLIQPIFQLLYPEVESQTFHTSRKLYSAPNIHYRKYLREVYKPKETLIYDAHGSFKTGRALFKELFGELPPVHLFSWASQAEKYGGIETLATKSWDWIEWFNLDTVGTLIDFTDTGEPIRAELTGYDAEIAREYRSCLDAFLTFIREPSVVRNSLEMQGLEAPWDRFFDEMKWACETRESIKPLIDRK